MFIQTAIIVQYLSSEHCKEYKYVFIIKMCYSGEVSLLYYPWNDPVLDPYHQ